MFSSILHGRKLQKCYSLRFVVNPLRNSFPFSNSFSSSVSDLSSQEDHKGNNFTISYLIDSLGLTPKLAESISKKVEDKGNAESVLTLLRSHGFTHSQISSVITGYPLLLKLDAEKFIAPKLKFLQSRGASSYELADTISKLPKILGLKWDKSIITYYDFVKDILEADKSCKHIKLSHSLPQCGNQENKLRNFSALRDLGVPQKLSHCSSLETKLVVEKKDLKRLSRGFLSLVLIQTLPRFVEALRIVGGLREETIEEKVDVYRKLGLCVEDIWAMFKKCLSCLTYSEKKMTQQFETLKKCGLLEEDIVSIFKSNPRCIGLSERKVMNSIETFLGLGFSRDEFVMMVKCEPACLTYSVDLVKKKTEFVVKKMNWPLKVVVSNTVVLEVSLEKRTIPRCNVITSLMVRGLIGDELPPLGSVCYYTDHMFLNRFVLKHDDEKLVAELMDIFTGKRVNQI